MFSQDKFLAAALLFLLLNEAFHSLSSLFNHVHANRQSRHVIEETKGQL